MLNSDPLKPGRTTLAPTDRSAEQIVLSDVLRSHSEDPREKSQIRSTALAMSPSMRAKGVYTWHGKLSSCTAKHDTLPPNDLPMSPQPPVLFWTPLCSLLHTQN